MTLDLLNKSKRHAYRLAKANPKQRYKMYKSHKGWLIASMTILSFGSEFVLGNMHQTKADSTGGDASSSSSSTESSTANQGVNVNYVDTDGNQVAESQTIVPAQGGTYDQPQQVEIPGYAYVGTEGSSQQAAGNSSSVTVRYAKVTTPDSTTQSTNDGASSQASDTTGTQAQSASSAQTASSTQSAASAVAATPSANVTTATTSAAADDSSLTSASQSTIDNASAMAASQSAYDAIQAQNKVLSRAASTVSQASLTDPDQADISDHSVAFDLNGNHTFASGSDLFAQSDSTADQGAASAQTTTSDVPVLSGTTSAAVEVKSTDPKLQAGLDLLNQLAVTRDVASDVVVDSTTSRKREGVVPADFDLEQLAPTAMTLGASSLAATPVAENLAAAADATTDSQFSFSYSDYRTNPDGSKAGWTNDVVVTNVTFNAGDSNAASAFATGDTFFNATSDPSEVTFNFGNGASLKITPTNLLPAGTTYNIDYSRPIGTHSGPYATIVVSQAKVGTTLATTAGRPGDANIPVWNANNDYNKPGTYAVMLDFSSNQPSAGAPFPYGGAYYFLVTIKDSSAENAASDYALAQSGQAQINQDLANASNAKAHYSDAATSAYNQVSTAASAAAIAMAAASAAAKAASDATASGGSDAVSVTASQAAIASAQAAAIAKLVPTAASNASTAVFLATAAANSAANSYNVIASSAAATSPVASSDAAVVAAASDAVASYATLANSDYRDVTAGSGAGNRSDAGANAQSAYDAVASASAAAADAANKAGHSDDVVKAKAAA